MTQTSLLSAGRRFRDALTVEKPLQIMGTINAYCALLAEQAGYRALYLSGAGVANASYGLPDLALTTLDNVLEDIRRITSVTSLPLLVDIDTGWGNALMINRVIRQLIQAGAAGVHLEDQVQAKRCGHLPGKALVSPQEMADRLKAALDARSDPDFVIMARTDALAVEGLERALERAVLYQETGADMLFPEALTQLEEYRLFGEAVQLPLLANMTEFGVTPLFTTQQLASVGVSMALYPLSAFRAMSAAALHVYTTIRQQGTQQQALPLMQTRQELYAVLRYETYQQKIDQLFGQQKGESDEQLNHREDR
ncbi:2-methylisocitrate lyase [Reticulibacter mediterranei]|uniref:2-methylisocitrate lyase n=1 Tax=Reticulibacter mediterranei TaxID=2778369 RepID=A0A8J3ITS9_9CHLR|nr:methylisocitrate lyase [Reticulibacter mediterranei]GHO98405.1 2-methylisocitrate lyase [Reticulibacter mediterranei]